MTKKVFMCLAALAMTLLPSFSAEPKLELKCVGVSVVSPEIKKVRKIHLSPESNTMVVLRAQLAEKQILSLDAAKCKIAVFEDDKGTNFLINPNAEKLDDFGPPIEETEKQNGWPEEEDEFFGMKSLVTCDRGTYKDGVKYLTLSSDVMPKPGAKELHIKGTIHMSAGDELVSQTISKANLKVGSTIEIGGHKIKVKSIKDDRIEFISSHTLFFISSVSIQSGDQTLKGESAGFGMSHRAQSDGTNVHRSNYLYSMDFHFEKPAKDGMLKISYFRKVTRHDLPFDIRLSLGVDAENQEAQQKD